MFVDGTMRILDIHYTLYEEKTIQKKAFPLQVAQFYVRRVQIFDMVVFATIEVPAPDIKHHAGFASCSLSALA